MRSISEKYSGPINSLMAIALTILIYYSSTHYMPWLGLFQIFPIATLFVSEGPVWTLLSAVVIGVTAVVLTSTTQMVFTMVYLLPGALCLGIMIKHKADFFHEIIVTSLVFLAAGFVQTAIAEHITGQSLIELIKENMLANYDSFVKAMMERSGGVDIPGLEYKFSKGVDIILTLLPGIAFLSSMVSVFFTSLLSHALLKAGGKDVEYYGLSNFEFPKKPAIAALVICALTPFLGRGESVLTAVLYNLTLVSVGIFFLNGFAYIDYMMKKRGRSLVRRIVTYILIIVFMVGAVFATIIGLVEAIFSIRDKERQKEDSNEGPY